MRAPNLPPSFAKTPTGSGAIRYNPMVNSTSTNGAKSPSRIPARVPLGNMPHGSNSPERRPPPQSYCSSTVSGKMPPPRAPPPKMRGLFVAPREETPQNAYHTDPERCPSAMSAMSSGNVRPMSPEDVYDDRSHQSYMTSSISQQKPGGSHPYQSFHSSVNQDTSCTHQQQQKHCIQQSHQCQYHPPVSTNRQISNSSTINTVTSGSENWETYDDASEPEADATDVYYAKLRATHGKRLAHEAPYGGSSGGKKIKGMRGVGIEQTLVEENGHIRRVEGSDAEWTDDLETY